MDNTALLADNLKWAPARYVSAADHLISLKKTKSPWDVITAAIKIWEESHPTEYDSFIIDLGDTKETRKVYNIGNKRFRGVSVDKGTGGMLRYKLDIPTRVVKLIRKIYPDMNMDREFYTEFAKRFPKMRVEEVV